VCYLATANYLGELDRPAAIPTPSLPCVSLSETNPLRGSVTVNTRRVTVLKLSSAPVLLTPGVVGLQHMRSIT
jgi:hypothetical protein